MINIQLQKKLNAASGPMDLSVEITIKHGEFVVIHGHSGAGKTSILRMIAGLLTPDEGQISIDGDCWFQSKSGLLVPPQKRSIGFIWQDFNLFPNMTVYQNLLFALEKNQDKNIIEELVEVMELENLQPLKPSQLSGGQKQRVALARALISKPTLLLLDEPLSALDQEMRIKMQDYLMMLHKNYQQTVLMVSHDATEITKMANRVYILSNGQIINQGSPKSLFFHQLEDKSFHLEGMLVSKSDQNDNKFFEILIGRNLLKIPVDDTIYKKYENGDVLFIEDAQFNPKVSN